MLDPNAGAFPTEAAVDVALSVDVTDAGGPLSG